MKKPNKKPIPFKKKEVVKQKKKEYTTVQKKQKYEVDNPDAKMSICLSRLEIWQLMKAMEKKDPPLSEYFKVRLETQP